MALKKIDTMVTAFRDGFQSVYGARVFTKDFLPAVEASVAAGIDHFEAGGGARFQSLFFYSNENAFDMMDAFRKTAPDANLQTLARGVNVVGLESQPRDIVKLHAELFRKHGITTIRNFDALNDVENLIYSGQCIHEAGLKHEVCVTLMALPPGCNGAHDPDFYESCLRAILDAGIPYGSVCFKDASGTTTPRVVHETVRRARRMLPDGTKIVFHTHDTAGTGTLCYMAALEAGATQVDVSMAPVSGGTCQPDMISLWHALRGTDYDLGIDIEKVIEAEEIFKECMKDYFLPPEAKEVEPLIPFSPMPGGALTANTQMLRDNGIMDKYPEIIKAMREVVRRGGFGTSVTPVSQFYFQQAFNNVLFGPWKKIADGYGKMVLGYFGRTPVTPDEEVVKICSRELGLEPTTKKVLDINDADPTKGVEAARKLLTDHGITDLSDENIFIAATCKEKGIAYLQGKAEVGVRLLGKEKKTDPSPPSGGGYTVTVNGKPFAVEIKGDTAVVNGNTYSVSVQEGHENPSAPAADPTAATGKTVQVKAPLPGKVWKIPIASGATVKEGDVLLILEAMKMEIEVKAPSPGTVSSMKVQVGDQVHGGQELATIS